MAIKHLAGNRLQGSNSERTGMNLGVTLTAPTVDTSQSGYIILKSNIYQVTDGRDQMQKELH